MDETTQSAVSGETLDLADPQGETPTPPSANGETPETTIDPAKELASIKAALKAANKEAAGYRLKAKELDDLKAKVEADKLSETEKLQKQLTELQTQYDTATKAAQERVLHSEVRVQAAQMGIVNPAVAAKLLDFSQVTYDEQGAPTNIGELLKDLVKAEPYLAGKAAAHTAGGATNPPRSQSTAPAALSWDAITKMNRAEYTARQAEIQQWMLKNPMHSVRSTQ